MYLLSFAQKRSSTWALCFSATDESFQTAGWKLVHVTITHFFCFLVVLYVLHRIYDVRYSSLISQGIIFSPPSQCPPHPADLSCHLGQSHPCPAHVAVLPRPLGSQHWACRVVETPIHPWGSTAAGIPVSWPWARVPATTVCGCKLGKKCSCAWVCSAALQKWSPSARASSCLQAVKHPNRLLLIYLSVIIVSQ